MGPDFKKRHRPEKYMVRFWSTKKDYADFTKMVRQRGLVIQDVFQDFMDWFTHSPELKAKDARRRMDATYEANQKLKAMGVSALSDGAHDE